MPPITKATTTPPRKHSPEANEQLNVEHHSIVHKRRAAARLSRARHRRYVDTLKHEVNKLGKVNHGLENEITRLSKKTQRESAEAHDETEALMEHLERLKLENTRLLLKRARSCTDDDLRCKLEKIIVGNDEQVSFIGESDAPVHAAAQVDVLSSASSSRPRLREPKPMRHASDVAPTVLGGNDFNATRRSLDLTRCVSAPVFDSWADANGFSSGNSPIQSLLGSQSLQDRNSSSGRSTDAERRSTSAEYLCSDRIGEMSLCSSDNGAWSDGSQQTEADADHATTDRRPIVRAMGKSGERCPLVRPRPVASLSLQLNVTASTSDDFFASSSGFSFKDIGRPVSVPPKVFREVSDTVDCSLDGFPGRDESKSLSCSRSMAALFHGVVESKTWTEHVCRSLASAS